MNDATRKQGFLDPEAEETSASAPSLDVLFSLIQSLDQAQDKHLQTLDSKAGFTLGSGSLLTAGLAGLQGSVGRAASNLQAIGASFDAPFRWFVVIMTGLVLLSYLALVICAYNAYKLRQYEAILRVKKMRDELLTQSEYNTKRSLFDTLVGANEANSREIDRKAQWVRRALWSLISQAIVLGVLLAVQTWLLLTF